MPERPPHPQADAPAPRDLAEIAAELAALSSERRGEASVMREAVVELSHAIARLLEMVREERGQQRARIAELEAELGEARRQLDLARQAGFVPAEPEPISGSDFDRLRLAAEQLRASTEQLVRADAPPHRDEATAGHPPSGELEGDGLGDRSAAAQAPAEPDLGRPAVLRVFPGAGADGDADAARPPEQEVEMPTDAQADAAIAAALAAPSAAAEAPGDAPDADGAPAPAADREPLTRVRPPEPVALEARPARRRKATLRRRRIDARRLGAVEPVAALRAMVAAIEPRWTAGRELDLVIALTDGATLKVSGGKGRELDVTETAPGTPARCTVTLTGAQVVPVFGRMALAPSSSPPLIHGERRDADALVAWIDRAQRLLPEPL